MDSASFSDSYWIGKYISMFFPAENKDTPLLKGNNILMMNEFLA